MHILRRKMVEVEFLDVVYVSYVDAHMSFCQSGKEI